MYDYNQPNSSKVLTDFMLALWHGINCINCAWYY